ncbi:MAG: DUF503 domain-containing protein [Candidatus Sericytochromatia bacterium]|nr:DUF503 domain-containing protein [Candidatus Sericytochromatia bacterium]
MGMMVGAMEVRLHLPHSRSLKDKRRIVQSVKTRVENEFHAAVAETEDLDLWQVAVLGVAVVSNDGRHANERLSKIVDFIERGFWDAELSSYELDVMPFF